MLSGLPRLQLILITLLMLGQLFSVSYAVDASLSPPSPPFILTVPRINEVTYVIEVKNVNASSVTIDLAVPRTRVPDTFVKIKEVKVAGTNIVSNYTDRENTRIRTYTPNFRPGQYARINVTFYSLKYKLEFSTHQPIVALSYPNDYTIYTQPETHIESNNPLVVNKAQTLVGNRTNPFRIAEKMYDFARSYITWTSQSDIRGALYALQYGRGDCTEFGTLFVSLMRAVGIPARTVIGHSAVELARGGIVNASSLWVDSPHLWAEFYVDGYGWVPVDPTFGKNDPESHFGTSWAYYLPLIRGPTMDGPNPSLASVTHPASTKVEFKAALVVNPLALAPLDKPVQDFMLANERTNLARRAAAKAFDLSFNMMETYPLLVKAYSSLIGATKALEQNDSALASQQSADARAQSDQILQLVSNTVISSAQSSVSRAWREVRVLGGLGGDYYLRLARTSQDRGDYLAVVQSAYFARTTADQAPNVLVFLGPVALSIFTIGMTWRRSAKNTSLRKHARVKDAGQSKDLYNIM